MDEVKSTKVGLKKEVLERTISYIIASFGLVAGLAWNEAIKSLIEYIFPLGQDTLSAKLIYAILATLLAVVMISYLVRLLNHHNETENRG